MTRPSSATQRGFTLIQLVLVLVLLGFLAAKTVERMGLKDSAVHAQAAAVRTNLRYAQLAAMKRNKIVGVKCDAASNGGGWSYWMFEGTNPATAANYRPFPGESRNYVALAGKAITLSAFTIFYDAYGRPYSAYTDAATNTPLAANLSLTINSSPASTAQTIVVTRETGFVQ
jgi:type II secretory pathway pseudopilin PulG